MSSTSIESINAAYVASWKEKNPNLLPLQTDGHYLLYQNQKIDISEIYMQDLLLNPILFQNINTIGANDLFEIIKLHINAIKIKERELKNKTRRLKNYESTL